MILETAILLSLIACLVICHKVWRTTNVIEAAVEHVVALHVRALKSISDATNTSLEATERINADAAKRIGFEHGEALRSITESHGEAAKHLTSVAGSHNVAASALVDGSLLLKQSADSLNALLGNSSLFEIKSHLEALRKFWCK